MSELISDLKTLRQHLAVTAEKWADDLDETLKARIDELHAAVEARLHAVAGDQPAPEATPAADAPAESA